MSEDSSNGSEQLEVLKLMWQEMKDVKASLEREMTETRRELGQRIDRTNEGLDAVRADLKDENDALRRRMVETEVRLGTVVTDLSHDVRELSGLIRDWREEHRSDRADIKARLLRLEQRAGFTS